jgi:hypothetical protein
MIRLELALALLFVGASIRSALAAFSREKVRSLGLEYEAAEAIDPDVDQGVQSRGPHGIIHR